MIFDQDLWHGFQKITFYFEEKRAILVFPKKADEKRNWMLKTEYWDAFPEREIDLLNKGFHLAYLENENRMATCSDCNRKARFCDYLTQNYGLREACVPVGMSLGGAHAVNFAGYYPEKVLCLFIDAPVLNFLSIPGKFGDPDMEKIWKNEFEPAYPGIKKSDLFDFSNHPINRVKTLLTHEIPIVMAYGTMDSLVPYEENGAFLAEAYQEKSDLLLVMPRPLQGHHPHGAVNDIEKLLNFIISHTK